VLYANQTVIDQFGLESIDDVEVGHAASEDEDRSLWEKIKDAFSFGDSDHRDDEHDPLYGYRDDIERDKLVVGVYDYQPMDKITDRAAELTNADCILNLNFIALPILSQKYGWTFRQ